MSGRAGAVAALVAYAVATMGTVLAEDPPAEMAIGEPEVAATAGGCNLTLAREVATLCQACHTLADLPGGHDGPPLVGVVGRRAGTLPGYSFSPALRESGIVWDRDNLQRFIENPARFVPGTTMAFVGLDDQDDRAALACLIAGADTGGS
ncbi:MAG: hypothetical protein R3E77_09570 [Steroidobacteraceae bacterium]